MFSVRYTTVSSVSIVVCITVCGAWPSLRGEGQAPHTVIQTTMGRLRQRFKNPTLNGLILNQSNSYMGSASGEEGLLTTAPRLH